MSPARVAAVTGGGAGIGLAIGKALARQGFSVHLADISDARLAEAADAFANEGLRAAAAHQVDVSQFEEVSEFVAAVVASSGRLDVLVNSAAVFDGYAGIEETTSMLWQRVIEINLTGCFYACKAAFPHMVEHEVGRIINIGSVATFRGVADGLAYDASKAGMLGLTRRLAIDLARKGVTVNMICPGSIKTDIRQHSEEILEGVVDMQRGISMSKELMDLLIPAGRFGTVDEVAALAVYLASDEAAYVTGQAICIDGGWTAT